MTFWGFVFGISYMAVVVVLVALKLTGALAWPWLWVLSPLWGWLGFSGLMFVYYWLRYGRELNMWPWRANQIAEGEE